MSTLSSLPTITSDEINAAADPLYFILLLTHKYMAIISEDPTGQIQQQMTLEQSILIAFVTMDDQISGGGFIQLIENKYGPYIFDTPLSVILTDWGGTKIASILDRARVIYNDKKEMLEREKTLEEFAKLYQEYPDFEELEKEYDSVIDSQRAIIKNYIEQHIADFAQIA